MKKIKLFITLLSFFGTPFHAYADWEFALDTRLILDVDYLNKYHQLEPDRAQTVATLDELKFSSELDFNRQWRVKAEGVLEQNRIVDSSGKEVISLKSNSDDLWIRWQSNDKTTRVYLGKMKEPLGHDRLMGKGNAPFIERSMVSSVFSPGRSLGMMAFHRGAHFTLSGGRFDSDLEEVQQGDEKIGAWTVRGTYNIERDQGELIHFAFSGSSRNLRGTLFQWESDAEIESAENIIRSAKFYSKTQEIAGLELAFRSDTLWAMAELYDANTQSVDREIWNYKGFYAQLIWGGRYRYKNGEFKAPKDSIGKVFWMARYSDISLNDFDLGTESRSVTIGTKYRVTNYAESSVNLMYTELTGSVLSAETDGVGASLRLIINF